MGIVGKDKLDKITKGYEGAVIYASGRYSEVVAS